MIETYSNFERGFDFLCELIEDKIKDHILIIPQEESLNFRTLSYLVSGISSGSIPLHDCTREKINIPLEEEKKIHNIIKELYNYLLSKFYFSSEVTIELCEGYWNSYIFRTVEGYVKNNLFFYLDCSITKDWTDQTQNDPFVISLKVCFLKPFGTGYKIKNCKNFFLFAGNLKQKEVPPPPSGISGLLIPPSIPFSGTNEDFPPKPERPALEYVSEITQISHRVHSDKDPGNDGESITKKFTWWEQFIAKRFFNS